MCIAKGSTRNKLSNSTKQRIIAAIGIVFSVAVFISRTYNINLENI